MPNSYAIFLHLTLKVKAQDRHGKIMEFEAEGFMAKCIQHELDHLNGKLFIDYLSHLKRNFIKKKIEKINRQGDDHEHNENCQHE